MAAASDRKVLEEIGEDFLCCTICLEQFKSPKILPCLHTFCEQCLVTLVEKTGSLHCPECRQEYQLPLGGVPSIKNNFFVANLIEIFKQRLKSTQRAELKCEGCQENTATHRCMQCKQYYCDSCAKVHRNILLTRTHKLMTIEEFETVQSTTPVTLPAVEYCSVHDQNELKFYCETCQVPVCTDCTIVKHRIPNHVHKDLKDAADEYLTELKAMVDKLKVKEQEAEKNKTLAKQIHTDLTEQCSKEERKVRMKAEEIIKKIKREEQRLIDELKNNYKMKIKCAVVEIDEMELKHGNIKSTCSYIEMLMHHGNAAQLLSTKGDAGNRIKQLIISESEPKLQYDEVVFTSGCDFNEHGILGILRSDVCTSKCTVDNIPKQLVKGDSADLLVTTRDSMGNQVTQKQPVKAIKVSKPDSSWEDIDVIDNQDCTHTVTVFGQVDGKYEVTMTVGDQPIPGCPVIIPVIKGLVKTIGSEGSNEGQYNLPWSVAINKNGDIVTADTDNNRLQITTRDGTFKNILKFPQFKMPFTPYDIAVCGEHAYYSLDNKNKQVVVSDDDGHVIRNFGQNELKDPRGIAISPLDGKVYVTEYDDDCVRIYTKHGKYLRSFGSYGNGQGEFSGPWGVVIGSTGMVFVADQCNNRIQVFNAHDQYLYSFDCESMVGELVEPSGITIENDKYIYLTAHTDDFSGDGFILKFESSGKFVCRIDSDSDRLDEPNGIALTDDVPCRVVVADTYNHCIKVFVQ